VRILPRSGFVQLNVQADCRPTGSPLQPLSRGSGLGSDGIRLRLPEICDATFMSYQLQTARHREWIIRHAAGTTMASLNESIIRDIPIVLPPLAEQRAIAAVLGALDDKIEQNRRTAQALERLARAIFRAWFVDFEPVKAKAAGAAAFPSMPQHVFDALPTRFIDSDLGPVPEGWEVKAIGDVVSVKGGGTPSTKNPEYWDGGVHYWATPKDMSRLSHPVLLDTERRITDAGVESISSGVLLVGTIVSTSGLSGHCRCANCDQPGLYRDGLRWDVATCLCVQLGVHFYG